MYTEHRMLFCSYFEDVPKSSNCKLAIKSLTYLQERDKGKEVTRQTSKFVYNVRFYIILQDILECLNV